MRFVSLNAAGGRTADGLLSPDRFVEAIEALAPDVLALQEVDCDQPRSRGIDFTALAAAAMGAVDLRFTPTVFGTPGGHWVPASDGLSRGRPAYGVALLSRPPVVAWRTVALAAVPMRAPVMAPGLKAPVMVRDEPRVGVIAELAHGAGPLSVCCTHLSFVPGWNAWQLRRLHRGLQRSPGPRLLLGDLNLPLRVVRRLLPGWRTLAHGASYPSARPRVQFDHALTDGPQLRLRAAEVRRTAISDHRAVIVELED